MCVRRENVTHTHQCFLRMPASTHRVRMHIHFNKKLDCSRVYHTDICHMTLVINEWEFGLIVFQKSVLVLTVKCNAPYKFFFDLLRHAQDLSRCAVVSDAKIL